MTKLKAVAFGVILASSLLAENSPALSTGLLPDPFFLRFDRAAEVLEATVLELGPAQERIKDKMFDGFPDGNFMKAKIKIVKSWKGVKKIGDVTELWFVSGGGALSDRSRLAELWLHKGHLKEKKIFYIRKVGRLDVATNLFGFSISELDSRALEATVAGKPEEEVVKAMSSDDRFFYQRQLRETGRIDRKAERKVD